MVQIHTHSNAHYKQSSTYRKNKRFVTRAGSRHNVQKLAASIAGVTLFNIQYDTPWKRLKTIHTRQYKRAVNVDLYLCLLDLKRMLWMC